MWNYLPAFLLVGLLTGACSAPSPSGPQPGDFNRLRAQVAVLPGAVVAEETGTITYPGEVLFAEGSALPLPGGVTLLNPLAAILASYPEGRWRATVRALTGSSPEYDQALAEKRAELLQRFFSGKGIAPETVEWFPEAAPGPPLEIGPAVPQPASAASSSRSKP